MRKRIRIDGVLYESVADGDWMHGVPEYVGDWSFIEVNPSIAAFNREDDLPVFTAWVSPGNRDDTLLFTLYLVGSFENYRLGGGEVSIGSGTVADAIGRALDAIEPALRRYGYSIEETADAKANDLDVIPQEAVDEIEDDDFWETADRLASAVSSAIRRLR